MAILSPGYSLFSFFVYAFMWAKPVFFRFRSP